MNDVSPALRITAVPTRIGALSVRHDRATDAIAFLATSLVARGVELWRAFLPSVAIRDANEDAPAAPLSASDAAGLDDDELDRTADAYLAAMLDADDAPLAHAVPRAEDERSSVYATRLLEAIYAVRSEPAQTTIDRLSTVVARIGDAAMNADVTRVSGGELSSRHEIAKEAFGEMRTTEDAVADAQKRVKEIQTLLVSREAERLQFAQAITDDNGRSVSSATSVPDASTPSDDAGGAQRSAEASNGRRGDAAALDKAAAANHKTAERLGELAQSLNLAVADFDEGRRRFETLVRRGLVTSVALLAVSCALIAANLAQDYFDGRALRVYEESARAQRAAQDELRQEIARLREERASLAARISQLESESTRLAEAAKPAVETVQAPEPNRTVEAARPVRASKSSRSSRSSKSAAPR